MRVNEVFTVDTSHNRSFWVLATSPGRAIAKLWRRRRALLDRGEKIVGARSTGTIDVF